MKKIDEIYFLGNDLSAFFPLPDSLVRSSRLSLISRRYFTFFKQNSTQ